jgi:hypothetical protein
MLKYPAIYTDRSGSVKTTIFNLFNEKGVNCLEMVVEGVAFIANSFDSFELVNAGSCTPEQLKRFTFNKVSFSGSDEFVMELCNCRLDFQIPQVILDLENEAETEAWLRVLLELGKPLKNGGISNLNARFTLSFDEKKFVSESSDFETAFIQIQKDMMPIYRFNNCFSCHYSDYSPLGSGFFATMMCFKSNKASYLTAEKKEDFLKLGTMSYTPVQETYLCNEFAPREKGTGYRGWPFGE